MTQTSRPTGQHTDNYPDGDSGPYSSLQWRTVFKELFTTDDDQGPIGGYLNELAVTNPIGKTMRVASGGAIVGGNVFFNDADVDFSPPNPAGAARYDYVVACLNDTDTVMTVSDAGHTLAFPTVLTDYNSASSIQEYACRLAIVRGAEGGGLPTLDQNDDHYMIPLASYLITTGGAVSSFTDRREFAGGMDSFFVPAVAGDDETLGDIYPIRFGATPINGIKLTDGNIVHALGTFVVPKGFTGDMSAKAVIHPRGSGDLYGYLWAYYGACGEAYDTHESGLAVPTTEAVTSSQVSCVNEVDLSDASVDDVVMLEYVRTGNNAADTVNADAYCPGFIVEYR